MTVKTIEEQYTSGVYVKRDRTIVRGRGARVWDEAGREYVDCVAGIGVANAGHCHPAIAEAIAEQAETLLSCPELFYNDRRARLLERLAEVTPGDVDRFFLCNSGTEAVEGALKFARLATGRSKVVAAMRGYHGRTLGALSATYDKKYRRPFVPLVPGFTHVPFDNVERAEKAVDEETAAVLVEIVQGEGGVRPGSPAYFQALRRLCDERGALLIIDEVQTGFGRTGRWFACEHVGVTPDLLCMGKAMAGGVPMGATGIGRRVTGIGPGAHSSTFGGNPLACAAALAALDVYEQEALPARAAEMGARFRRRLEAIDSRLIREVRGLGLMMGIELRIRAMPIVEALMEEGVLALTAGSTVLRLLPPLIIEWEDLERGAEAIEEVLASHEH
ncbi:MAG: aspartate aminotransferase family protein [Candidatus Promineifilaceae bacterium]|nr:aspartate aminotransferase family protein [Candidatus Promineifilaceae bacterium]